MLLITINQLQLLYKMNVCFVLFCISDLLYNYVAPLWALWLVIKKNLSVSVAPPLFFLDEKRMNSVSNVLCFDNFATTGELNAFSIIVFFFFSFCNMHIRY